MIYESGRDANKFCVKLRVVHTHFNESNPEQNR